MDLTDNHRQDSAGFTDILAGQLSWIEDAVLTYDIALATQRNRRTVNTPYLFKNSIAVDNPLGVMGDNSSLTLRKVFLPSEKLMENDPGLGFNYHRPDDDGVLRRHPAASFYDGYYYPSAALRQPRG